MMARVINSADVTLEQKDQMIHRMVELFHGVQADELLEAIDYASWVALVVDGGGEVCGFSLLEYRDSTFESRAIGVVYSGDTAVAPYARSSACLPQAWAAIASMVVQSEMRPTYWYSICNGCWAYRLMPTCWARSFPRYDCATPQRMRRLIDKLGAERYGDAYVPAEGKVVFDRPYLPRGKDASVPCQRVPDPHTEYFLRENPGYVKGDELACCAEMSDANLTPLGRRILARSRLVDCRGISLPARR